MTFVMAEHLTLSTRERAGGYAFLWPMVRMCYDKGSLSAGAFMQELVCRAILFDMDGVLVDSTACVERHWRMWAAHYALDAELILAHSHGKRSIDTLREVAAHLDLDLEREARLLEEEEAKDLEGIVALPGALELVTGLPPESWAIVTSATYGMAEARLRAVGLPIPRAFVTAEEVRQGKPDPE